MGGVNKAMSKGFKFFRKFDAGQRAEVAVLGQKNYDKEHFISTGIIKNADKQDAAEKELKSAQQLAEDARQQQMVDSAELDDEENRRIKKLLSGSRGARGYRGGSMFRGRPSNTAARSAASAGGAVGSPASAAMRSGGRSGGLGSFRYANESVNQ